MTRPRFLIDENLSVHLPGVAHAHGYDAAHVSYRGLRTWKDWNILEIIAEEDWVLVTNNAFEFRGRFQRLELHPGIVFLVPSVPRLQQLELFSAALADVDQDPDLVNTALDVSYSGNRIIVRRYDLP